MAGKLRRWFLRNILEAVEREFGAGSVEAVTPRVPPRLRPHLSLDRLRASTPLDTLPLDEGEEVLLALDGALGDGSGRALERAAADLVAKSLAQAGSAVRVGDLFGTVARLRGLLEHPFEGVAVTFELSKTATGLTLAVGIAGQPRATKVLRHLAHGAIVAAERFAREAAGDSLKLTGDLIADRARIHVHLRALNDAPSAEEVVPPTRRPSSLRQAFPATLAAEVDRILNPSLVEAERRRSESTPPPPPQPSTPSVRSSRPSSVPPPPQASVGPARKISAPNLRVPRLPREEEPE